jgi:glycerol-3-phosphate dehydrogenase (NAD(P)+)
VSGSIGVIGGGPWGVALARSAARSRGKVTLCTRRGQDITDTHFTITGDLAETAKSKLVVIAVPSSVVRVVLRELGDHIDGSHMLVHGIRGLDEHLMAVSDIMREETPARRIGALGGPVQADELHRGLPSAMVCGSHFPEVIAAVTQAFQHSSLRVYGTPDVHGLEWASAMVGCLAIGVGYAKEAGAGPGLLAALISRGVDEAARITAAAGCEERTMLGLGGYGDLLASIALDNRPEVIVGKALAHGKSVEEAIAEAKLRVEAIPLVPRIVTFAKERKVGCTTFQVIADVLKGGVKAPAMLERLFAN